MSKVFLSGANRSIDRAGQVVEVNQIIQMELLQVISGNQSFIPGNRPFIPGNQSLIPGNRPLIHLSVNVAEGF